MSSENLPPSTPLDVRRGVTDAADVAHPLRWGILGAGSISAQWVESLQACKGASVTAVAAREMSRAQAFADALDIPRAYDDYAVMAAADDVDIVYVGTITRLHKEHSLIAIEAGKHVLCEETAGRERRRRPGNVRRRRGQGRHAPGCHVDAVLPRRGTRAVRHRDRRHRRRLAGAVGLLRPDLHDPGCTARVSVPTPKSPTSPPPAYAGGGAGHRRIRRPRLCRAHVPARSTANSGKSPRSREPRDGSCSDNRDTVRPTSQSAYRHRMACRRATGPETRHRRNKRFDYPLPGNVAMARAFPNQHGIPLPGRSGAPLSRGKSARVPAIRQGGVPARHGSPYPHPTRATDRSRQACSVRARPLGANGNAAASSDY